jgi:GNAT superfamily N-acetyltransferase
VPALAFPLPGNVTLTREAYSGDGPRWVVAQAEAELVERYGGLDAGEFGLTADLFDPPAGAFLIARHTDHPLPVGGVGVRTVEPGLGEVRRLWVDPVQRGRGIALALMEGLEHSALELGLSHLQLGTGYKQPEAVALYERTGWTRLEVDEGGRPLPYWYIRFSKHLG